MARSRRLKAVERPSRVDVAALAQELRVRRRTRARVAGAAALRAPTSDRGRQIQRTMTGGALGGGALMAGFGLVPAFAGAVIGAALGYLFERSSEAVRAEHPA
jgi:hypothetical protein